ncbi:putative inorganic phosphate cotransporter [Harmonia axyridis]|uniref:putative inorganic phosphate cotransporter n=1 Tax=Harmonia axyridis TaxID=115357 RepID=UPI001E27620E|nr:putative inorganic phosphate cotransporter [Harmonia axyridis]
MKCYSARYCTAILLSLGLAIVYGLKVNYHVAVVAMVNHTALAILDGKNVTEEESGEDGPFEWSHFIQGIQLSAYFWGYMISEIPGGRVAEVYSAKWTMFVAVGVNVVFTLLVPLLSSISAYAIVVMRVMVGLAGGISFPGTHVLLARWSPPKERSLMSSIAYCGTAAGTVIFTLISGPIANGLGWQFIFYIEGGISALWLIVWSILGADFPEKQRFMSAEEKEFMVNAFKEEGGGGEHGTLKVPWKAVFSSAPFWAIIIAHLCSNWGWYMVLTELPTYMKNVLNFKIKENALLSALPYFCMFIFSLTLGKCIDILRSKELISTTVGRKIATGIASIVPGFCFAALCFITEPIVAVILMTVSITGIGGMYCGFLSNHIDLSPNFAGTLMAITNTIASIPGILVPLFVGWLCEEDSSISSWRIVFYVTIVLYIIEVIVYLILGSGDEQPWNRAA